jgi:hypothetical protein
MQVYLDCAINYNCVHMYVHCVHLDCTIKWPPQKKGENKDGR